MSDGTDERVTVQCAINELSIVLPTIRSWTILSKMTNAVTKDGNLKSKTLSENKIW